ncbi:hypothetical protein BDN72DRAFT_815966 [Pluteus cervinus]|uniref:Uncharacterized protein n=1 Tax=Pluteus cervinus TaxID=181527 RepID=A0ACD3B451_9AGAR|nr:hypothetical protein BDN72DRAFT_815966 [Pluteus cervinus]
MLSTSTTMTRGELEYETNLTLCLPRPSSGLDPRAPVLVNSPIPRSIPPDHVLIRVDRFGFSANNITYQALGEHPHFRYFDFHPAPETHPVSPHTHGLIPVWGFGTILESTHPKIHAGERVYGYLAPTRYLVVSVSSSDVNKHAFYVPRPHLPPDRRPYNQIIRCANDPTYDPNPVIEDVTMLYRPLFWTAYWCEDWLSSTNYRNGATTILISSASSKTAFCLAYLIRKRLARQTDGINPNTKVIGLTSRKNVAFTQKLGFYHEVLEYDTFVNAPLLQGKGNRKRIYLDVAGNDNLNERILEFFSTQDTENLAGLISLGMTNVSPSTSASNVEWKENNFGSSEKRGTGTQTGFENFFMVEWLNVRKHQLPMEEIFRRQNEAWKDLMKDGISWVQLTRIYGGEQVKREYTRLAKQGLGPDQGMIWSLWDEQLDSKYMGTAKL